MTTPVRFVVLAAVFLATVAPSCLAADLDRTAVDFVTPADIKWVRNAAGTNEQAVLFGDPSKPGPYVVRIKWLPGNMSRPHFIPTTASSRFSPAPGGWATRRVQAGQHGAGARGQLRHPLRRQGALRRGQGRGDDHSSLGMGPATSTPAVTR